MDRAGTTGGAGTHCSVEPPASGAPAPRLLLSEKPPPCRQTTGLKTCICKDFILDVCLSSCTGSASIEVQLWSIWILCFQDPVTKQRSVPIEHTMSGTALLPCSCPMLARVRTAKSCCDGL